MTQLELISVSRSFGGITAIEDISFGVESGRITGIIGPNGAGKTTIFNIITGVYAASAGEILFEGKSLAGLRPDSVVRRGIARTFQNIRLFKRLSCLDNVVTPILQRRKCGLISAFFRLGTARRVEREAREEARKLLLEVQLPEELHGRESGTLPYGLQRKLEMARAIAASPKLLLLDEPAAGMNPEETRSLLSLIADVRRKFDLTILLIEHHMDLVMNLCDRVIVIDRGRLLAEGTPDEVRHDAKVVEAYLGKKHE